MIGLLLAFYIMFGAGLVIGYFPKGSSRLEMFVTFLFWPMVLGIMVGVRQTKFEAELAVSPAQVENSAFSPEQLQKLKDLCQSWQAKDQTTDSSKK